MREISLQELLEAGCHFGHKVTRWHPKAAAFIYQPREGVHIIDLVKTRDWLKKAGEFVTELGRSNRSIMYIASKRQAKGVVSESAKRAGIPYMTNRWIGGFMTNWDAVKKNIEKMNKWSSEKTDGTWEKNYPKHEIVKLSKELRKMELIYTGVKDLTHLPEAVFIIDINKEDAAIKEAARKNIQTVAIVDTNANPDKVDFPIPANDDAVGSIQYVVEYLTDCYMEGKKIGEKANNKELKTDSKKAEETKPEIKKPVSAPADAKAKVGKKATVGKKSSKKPSSTKATRGK